MLMMIIGSSWSQLHLFPFPEDIDIGYETRYLDPQSFKIYCRKSCNVIKDHINRYMKYIFYASSKTTSPYLKESIQSLYIDATSLTPLLLGVNESYTIQISRNATYATITADTEWGAIRGLETFSQLVSYDYTKNTYSIPDVPLTIFDEPRFKYRGLMIDTSRHYLPVKDILRTLDAMSFNKMNILHWHIVDEQSFPLYLNCYPDLSKKAAWNPNYIYKADDIKQVINYAYTRGILVIPEIDTPGHAKCWAKSYPDLFPTTCNSENYVLDVTQPSVYEFVKNIFKEVALDLFPNSLSYILVEMKSTLLAGNQIQI